MQEAKSYSLSEQEFSYSPAMDKVRKLILSEMEKQKSSLAEWSKAIGKNHAYLQQFVHRGVPAELPEKARRALAKVTKIPESKLTADGRRVVPIGQEFDPDPPPAPEHSQAHGRRDVISTVHPYEPDLPDAMPVVSSALSAGPGQAAPEKVNTHTGGITYSAAAVLGEITLPRAVSSSLSAAPTSRIHWFEVRGDSMEPTLSGGDWVGVNTLDLAIGQGGVFALLDGNGEILVKRLRRLRGEDSSKVQIVSDNPRQGVDTEDLNAITIFGRIVARISRVG